MSATMKISHLMLNRFINSSFVTKMRSGTRYMFQRHLLLTNIAISASISTVGDSIEQNYEKYKDRERKYEVRRTLNMSGAGVTTGVVCHYWYIWLDKYMPGRTFKIAMKKMLLDQVINSPITIATFFITLAVLERSSATEFIQELRAKSWRLYLAEWVIWPPAQLINFFWLPLKYRVLYDNTISMCYDVYTSYVKHEIPVEIEEPKPVLPVAESAAQRISNSLGGANPPTVVAL
ncbi:Mpv17-like protein 2 [Orchesella cincta]|uniref:Mpv17-like protein 2 n=1 Tax=Orchesella cincta TaxID=48709 RepID=A0A1D2NN33_ORCCI|nr:Mpv17-like protein 2 [Orchesella cincta]